MAWIARGAMPAAIPGEPERGGKNRRAKEPSREARRCLGRNVLGQEGERPCLKNLIMTCRKNPKTRHSNIKFGAGLIRSGPKRDSLRAVTANTGSAPRPKFWRRNPSASRERHDQDCAEMAAIVVAGTRSSARRPCRRANRHGLRRRACN